MQLALKSPLLHALAVALVVSIGSPARAGQRRCPTEKGWESKLLIHHIDVGQGDATFIRTPSGTTILIDGGPPGQGKAAVLPVLETCYHLKSLDYVLVTHPHADHFGGITELLKQSKKISINKLYDTGDVEEFDRSGPSSAFANYRKAARTVSRETPSLGDTAFVSKGQEVSFSVLSANGEVVTAGGGTQTIPISKEGAGLVDANAASISLKIHYGTFDYFIGGDLTGNGDGRSPDLESLVAPAIGEVDVYHANHHGSLTSSNEALLKALNPKHVIISVGSGGVNAGFFHLPSEPVIERMQAQADLREILMTSKGEGTAVPPSEKYPKMQNMGGDIVFLTDGDHYTINGKRKQIATDGK